MESFFRGGASVNFHGWGRDRSGVAGVEFVDFSQVEWNHRFIRSKVKVRSKVGFAWQAEGP